MKNVFSFIFLLSFIVAASLKCGDPASNQIKLPQDSVMANRVEDTSSGIMSFRRNEVFKRLSLTRTLFNQYINNGKRVTFQFYQKTEDHYTLIAFHGKQNDNEDPYEKAVMLKIESASQKLPLDDQNLILGDQKLIKDEIKYLAKDITWTTLMFEPKLVLNPILSSASVKFYNIQYEITAYDKDSNKINLRPVYTNPSPPASVSTNKAQ